jgi:hypothetical protein
MGKNVYTQAFAKAKAPKKTSETHERRLENNIKIGKRGNLHKNDFLFFSYV